VPHLACLRMSASERGAAQSCFRHLPAAPGRRQKGLPVITRRTFANGRCGLAPFPLAAFSSLEIAEQGPGMASLRCGGKWPGVPAAASGREAARRPRGDPEPGRDRAERLVAGTWRRASAYHRVRNGGRPAHSQVRRHDGKVRPWPRPWPGLDRPLAARSWPRFLRGRRDRAGRIPPA